ncbi:glycosyltransferase [Methylorubrum extorquens]|uniref:Glycosyl transferase family 2 n=1 Tax=Methylorubrum extorquens (strain CM4 / NCIMB 13688) TaxID=440085 RepID=B7KYP6_METC4|nr:glycosyltransferase [Methylorubrum extorquens]ACK84797.1 glycosyl transferase family 2 [Methylorubrum extorquens CM4]
MLGLFRQAIGARPQSTGSRQDKASLAALNQLCENVRIVEIKDITVGDDGALRFLSDDAWLLLELAPAVKRSRRPWQIEFAVEFVGPAAAGRLYLDCGEDFSERLSLALPTVGSCQLAALPYPEDLRRLRWDPTDRRGEAVLTRITARPVPLALVQASIISLSEVLLAATPEISSVVARSAKVDQIADLFDESYYLISYPDVAQSEMPPLEHFLKHGGPELRNPNAHFDSRWYAETNEAACSGYAIPLEHYIERGTLEGRDPNPNFDTAFYVDNHPEARKAPLRHYLTVGQHAATKPAPNFDAYLPSGKTAPVIPTGIHVDVVIPVYRGLEETQACLRSVLADDLRPPGRIIVVDDCSPEPALSAWLSGFARKREDVRLIRNRENRGFVASVNIGMRAAGTHDVVLLNSDTEVPKGWLRRLGGHAYSDPRIATVTPLSNNATICSYPTFAGGPLPFGLSVGELDAAACEVNGGRSVSVPTAVGFAMYIRRRCLDEYGAFDEEAFGRGYGEENDFCMRVSAAGWSHKLACDVFVYHAGEVSFGKASPERARAERILSARYPQYNALVARHVKLDPAAPYRFALTAFLLAKADAAVTMVISHTHGGGTERHIRELIGEAGASRNWLALRSHPTGAALTMPTVEGHPQVVFGSNDLDALIRIIRSCRVSRAHIHSVHGFGLSVRAVIEALELPFDFTVHDYLTLCPQVNLLSSLTGQYCGEPAPEACHACIAAKPQFGASDIRSWRLRHSWLFHDADRVLCPSLDVLQRLGRYGLADRAMLAPHSWSGPEPRHPDPDRLAADETFRVAILGVLAPIKGQRIVEDCVRVGKPFRMEFLLIGSPEGPIADDVASKLVVTGRYAEDELQELISRHAPHAIWFPGIVPETYSYTLDAALKAELPIIAGDLGAIATRLSGRPWTILVPPALDPDPWFAAFWMMREALRVGTPPQVHHAVPPSDDHPVRNSARSGTGRAPLLLLPDQFGNGSPTPCGYIRTLLPYADLAETGAVRVDVVGPEDIPYVKGAALLTQRHVTPDPEQALRILDACSERDLPIVYDLDDDLVDVPDDHIYADYLLPRREVVQRFIGAADLVTVSTQPLAEKPGLMAGRCIVIPNALDDRTWSPVAIDTRSPLSGEGEAVRLLYFGTVTHDDEYRMILPALLSLKEAYDDAIEIDLVGVTTDTLPIGLNRLVPPNSSYPAVAQWLSSQARWEIGLAPLRENSFNDVKSNIKLLDYAALRLAIVASNVPPYRGHFADAGGALLVDNSVDAWFDALTTLIASSAIRNRMADAAYETLSSEFTLRAMRGKRLDALASALPTANWR